MNKERKYVRVVSWRIVWAAMAILVAAAPYAKCLTVPAGETWNLDYALGDTLDVYGTANLLPGFYLISNDLCAYGGSTVNVVGHVSVDGSVRAYDGSTVNYIGTISTMTDVVVSPGANFTIYGTNFTVKGEPCETPADVTIGYAFIHWTCEDGRVGMDVFIGRPSGEVHLRAPGPGEPQQVEIDIKPGSYPNSINLKSKGVVPVAILTTGDFDAQTVDASTVEFAGAAPVRWALEDVDGDDDQDMVLHFKTQELNLDEDSTEADLTGNTTDGESIEGIDSVNIVPQKNKNK